MKWSVAYSRRADDFINEHSIHDRVRDAVRKFILRITG